MIDFSTVLVGRDGVEFRPKVLTKDEEIISNRLRDFEKLMKVTESFQGFQKLIERAWPELFVEEPLLLKNICINVLDQNPDIIDPITGKQTKRLPAAEKLMRADLAMTIYKAKKPIDLEAGEVELLKKLLADSGLSNFLYREVIMLLDPAVKNKRKGDDELEKDSK